MSDVASALTGSVSSDGQTTITGQLKFPNGSAAAPAVTFASDLTTGMYFVSTGILGFATSGVEIAQFNAAGYAAGSQGNVFGINAPAAGGASSGVVYPCPIGTVLDYAGTTAPSGWFLCFGQSLSATSYPELALILGTTYGTSVGNVVLPDLRDRATYGKGNMGGVNAFRITQSGGNYDGSILGNSGGAENQTLTQAQLPVTTPTFSGTTVTPTFTGTATAYTSSTSAITNNPSGSVRNDVANIGVILNTATLGTISTIVTPIGTVSGVTAAGTISSFGTGTFHTILSPGLILNKMIFAGRP